MTVTKDANEVIHFKTLAFTEGQQDGENGWNGSGINQGHQTQKTEIPIGSQDIFPVCPIGHSFNHIHRGFYNF